MKYEEVITCRVDRETKNKIKATNINESKLIRMSLKQAIKHKNNKLSSIVYKCEINNQKIILLENITKMLTENIKKYNKNIKRVNEVEKPINMKSVTFKQLEESKDNIRKIMNRGVEVNEDMLEYNANLAGVNVNRFVEMLKEDDILPEHIKI